MFATKYEVKKGFLLQNSYRTKAKFGNWINKLEWSRSATMNNIVGESMIVIHDWIRWLVGRVLNSTEEDDEEVVFVYGDSSGCIAFDLKK